MSTAQGVGGQSALPHMAYIDADICSHQQLLHTRIQQIADKTALQALERITQADTEGLCALARMARLCLPPPGFPVVPHCS